MLTAPPLVLYQDRPPPASDGGGWFGLLVNAGTMPAAVEVAASNVLAVSATLAAGQRVWIGARNCQLGTRLVVFDAWADVTAACQTCDPGRGCVLVPVGDVIPAGDVIHVAADMGDGAVVALSFTTPLRVCGGT